MTQVIAELAIAVLVCDLEYSDELPPTYGHVPIRHHTLWRECKSAMGEQRFKEIVEYAESVNGHNGEAPCKTNPWLQKSPSVPTDPEP